MSFIDEDLIRAMDPTVIALMAGYAESHGANLRAKAKQPYPPFPDPSNPMLKYLVDGTHAMVDHERMDLEQALVHLAVHAWYEGNIEGREQAEKEPTSNRHFQ